jgi:hypothetical protein
LRAVAGEIDKNRGVTVGGHGQLPQGVAQCRLGGLLVEQQADLLWRVDAEGRVDQHGVHGLGVVEHSSRQRAHVGVVGNGNNEGVAIGEHRGMNTGYEHWAKALLDSCWIHRDNTNSKITSKVGPIKSQNMGHTMNIHGSH